MKHPAKRRLNRADWIPLAVLGAAVLYVLSTFHLTPVKSPFHINDFGRLPVLNGGRIKPLDSVARTSLLMISGRQSVRTEKGRFSATEWLLDVLYRPSVADTLEIFQIDDPEVLGLMGIQQTTQRRFSFNDLRLVTSEIEKQAGRAELIPPGERTRFESAVLVLYNRMMLYFKLQNTLQPSGATEVAKYFEEASKKLAIGLNHHMHRSASVPRLFQESAEFLRQVEFMTQAAEFFPIPQTNDLIKKDWLSMGDALLHRLRTQELNLAVIAYAQLGDARRSDDSSAFNSVLVNLKSELDKVIPGSSSRVRFEYRLNHAQPFYTSILLYVVVFLIAFVNFLFGKESLRQSATALLAITFILHTFGLISRMIIQGRPPVTNLYSSAIFVGWAAVLLGLILERMTHRGIGNAVAAFIGFATLIIAHNLTSQGDTMEMMSAVLDSNFWLATHVITITVGYSAAFVSGMIAMIYLTRRVWDPNWKKDSADLLFRMTIGGVSFSTFFSFLGTVLGGIWADQSWGRFWGWDPKENGALMIVLWNVFILHARLSPSIRQKSIMIMAVFGNIITALSWFGVNMLGIGLHSYGFMDKAFLWLMVFVASQIGFMVLGWVPRPRHRSKVHSQS